jgi:DNA uptake protein ComE-like DNA-binding protein
MKEILRAFFSYSALERKGIVLLIILILVITGINFYLAHHQPEMNSEDHKLLVNELRSFERQLTLKKDSDSLEIDSFRENLTLTPELFFFDPNDASARDLRRLGFSNGVIRTLLNYRKHGGRFHQREDLKKIYGMSSGLYSQLYPYVKIKGNSTAQAQMPSSKPVVGSTTLNINLADSSDFEKLPGIGPVLARRIVRYRSLLGGFYDTGQLKEVYGITDSLYLVISTRVFADTTAIKKLNLNEAGENDLAHHPYIGKYSARGIIRYRSSVHTIKSIHELNVNGLISVENLEKLKKYLLI